MERKIAIGSDMACPTKRQQQAKSQRSSRAKVFDNGFIEDLLEVTLDPNYHPDVSSDSEVDSDTHSLKDMTFSLMDASDIDEESVMSDNSSLYGEDEADTNDLTCIGEKRKIAEDFNDAITQLKSGETVDYVEECAHQAAISAHKFWADIMNSVHDPLILIRLMT